MSRGTAPILALLMLAASFGTAAAAGQPLGTTYTTTFKGTVTDPNNPYWLAGLYNASVTYYIDTSAAHDFKSTGGESAFVESGDKNPGAFLTVDLALTSPGSDYTTIRRFTSAIGGGIDIYNTNNTSKLPSIPSSDQSAALVDTRFYGGDPNSLVLGYFYAASKGWSDLVQYGDGAPTPLPSSPGSMASTYYLEVADFWNFGSGPNPRFPTALREAFTTPSLFDCSYNNKTCDGGVINLYSPNGAGGDPVLTLKFEPTVAFAPAAAAPEPGMWALMMLGVGVVGQALRSGRHAGARAIRRLA